MNLSHLHTALTVAETGSLAETARQLDMDPSAVSRQLSALEHQLGLRLFQRSTRALTVTEGGAAYLARVSPLVAELHTANAQAADRRAQGLVRLTASVAFGTECLVPLLPKLNEMLPDVSLDLTLSDDNLDLVAARQDIAIRLTPKPTGDWIVRKLRSTRYVLCAAPSWLQQRNVKAAQDFALINCLKLSVQNHGNQWRFRKDGVEETVPVSGAFTFTNPLALRSAVELGLGPAVLADWLAAEKIAQGALIPLLPDHQVTATDFDTAAYILTPSRRHVPASTKAVSDFLVQHLS